MPRTLLVGPAGSGKTQALLDDFEQKLRETSDPLQNDFFFVLPSAEHTERVISLIVQRKIKGFFHRRVTTLSSLISEFFEVGDDGLTTNVTRYLTLKNIMENHAFEFFEDVQATPGFLSVLLNFVMELKDSLISVETFRERLNAVKALEPDLTLKYETLARIYELYQEAITEKGLRDRQDNLKIYRELKQANQFKTKKIQKIWMDGFFDFSELQYAYLEELCEMTEDLTVTLTYDPRTERAHLFEALEPTLERFKALGFEIKEIKKEKATTALDHVTSNLFTSRELTEKPKPTTEVTVYEAIGMDGEIEMIARTIRHMYRTGDYRFSDFAILLRQIGEYESIVRSIFTRYGIPVEVHERERLGFAPLIQVVATLVKIFKENWQHEDVMSFLKSAYVRKLGDEQNSYQWVSELENYSKRARVFKDREAWNQDWKIESEDASTFNQVKKKRLGVISEGEKKLREAKHYSEFRSILLEMVTQTFSIFERAESQELYARRDVAAYQRLESILDEIETSISHQKNQPDDLFEAFSDRFFRLIDLDLYTLRSRDKNQVQVYDVSLARQKEYRVVFVAGLLEKKFPVQIKEDPILSDWERQLFNGSSETERLTEKLPRQAIERYLFYLAVSRAQEKLFLTYPHLNLEGKESLSSYYVDEVQILFDGKLSKRRQELSRPFPSLQEITSDRELEITLMGELWTPLINEEELKPSLFYLTSEVLKRAPSQKRFKRAFYEIENAFRDPAVRESGAFYREVTSPTRLEEYAKCAFKHYAHRILKLDDPDDDVNVRVRGTVLHDVLEHFFMEAAKKPALLKDVQGARKTIVKLLEKALKNNPLILEKKYQYDLEYAEMLDILMQFLETELTRLQTSQFKPKYYEYDFGGDEGDAPALEISDDGRKILVRGKIDRVDVDASGENALVMDYKRSATFNKKDLELGTALQLPLYVMAVERFLKLKPTGGELYSLRLRKNNGFYNQAHAELLPQSYGRRLMLAPEKFQEVLERGVEYIKKFTREMEDLNIQVRPRACESYCPYSSVCRIEKWKLPIILEEIKKEDETHRVTADSH